MCTVESLFFVLSPFISRFYVLGNDTLISYVFKSTSEIRMRLVPSNMFIPVSNFLTDRSKGMLFCGSFMLFVFSVCFCHIVGSLKPCDQLTSWLSCM